MSWQQNNVSTTNCYWKKQHETCDHNHAIIKQRTFKDHGKETISISTKYRNWIKRTTIRNNSTKWSSFTILDT